MHPRLLGTLAALSLMMSACGGEQAPYAEPPSPSQGTDQDSPEPPPGETPPETPGALASATPAPQGSTVTPAGEESLNDFAIRWLAVGDEMQVTGNTAAYRKLSTAECEACHSFIDQIESIYGGGGHVEFDGSTFIGITDRKAAAGLTRFQITYEIPETRWRSGPKTQFQTEPSGEVNLTVTVRKVRGSWKLVSFQAVNE